MPRRTPLTRRAPLGFTLIEVMISLAVLSMITVLSYQAMSGTLALTELAREDEETINSGRVAIQRMSREISMSFHDPRAYRGQRRQGGTLVETYKTMMKGTKDSSFDTLTFTTFSHVRLYHGSKEGDQTEISYYAETDPDDASLFVLMHRESPRIDGDPEEGGVSEILARGVQELHFQYYDYRKEEWVDEWDTESSENRRRLPKGVAIHLILQGPDGEPRSYRTRVLIPLWRALLPKLQGRPLKSATQSSSRSGSGAGNPLNQDLQNLLGGAANGGGIANGGLTQ